MQQFAGEPAPERTDNGAAEDRGEAEIEPNDRCGPGSDKLAHGAVAPVDHPAFASRRLRRAAAKLGRRFRPPVRPPKKSSSSKRGLLRTIASRFEKIVLPEQLIPTTRTRSRSSLAGGSCIRTSPRIVPQDFSRHRRSTDTPSIRPSRARRAFCKTRSRVRSNRAPTIPSGRSRARRLSAPRG